MLFSFLLFELYEYIIPLLLDIHFLLFFFFFSAEKSMVYLVGFSYKIELFSFKIASLFFYYNGSDWKYLYLFPTWNSLSFLDVKFSFQ